MPPLEIADIEPFLYDSAPVDPVSKAETDYYGTMSSGAASSSGVQINDQKIELYLNRIREALLTDLTALEARVTALEP